MPIVLDTSVAASWILDDETDAYALRVLDMAQAGERLFVPTLFFSEFTNLLVTSCRRGRLTRADFPIAIQRIGSMRIEEIRLGAEEIMGLSQAAMDWEVTAYDALYIELARQRQLPLATLDRGMRNGAGRAGVRLFGD